MFEVIHACDSNGRVRGVSIPSLRHSIFVRNRKFPARLHQTEVAKARETLRKMQKIQQQNYHTYLKERRARWKAGDRPPRRYVPLQI